MDKVSVLSSSKYSIEELIPIIQKHFENLGGIDRFIKKNMRVLIKPNLFIKSKPDSAAVTHPAFIEALVRVIMERGAYVTIAESTGNSCSPAYIRSHMKETGINGVAERTGCKINFDSQTSVLNSNKHTRTSGFNVLSCTLDADIIISASKLKTHSSALYSGSVKNIFGLIPGTLRKDYFSLYPNKNDFCDMLVDFCEAVKPELSFVDAIYGMEGNGPVSGSPKFIGCTLASESPYAADLASAYLIGLRYDEIPLLNTAVKRGLCPESAEHLINSGDSLDFFCQPDFKRPSSFKETAELPGILKKSPRIIRKLAGRVIAPKVCINTYNCTGCGECAEGCPKRAIAIINGKAKINYKNCINCFYCQELCHDKAIDILKKL